MKDEFYSREWNWIEQISASFHVFAASIGSVLKTMAVVFLPITILLVIIGDRMMSAYTVFQQVAEMELTMANQEQFTATAQQVMVNYGLMLMVSLFLQPVGIITLSKVAKQYITEQKVSFREALAESFSLMPTIITTGILYGVIVFLASLLLIPGIYLSVAWGFYLCAVGLSGKKGMEALRYSKRLVAGKWFRTFAYLCLLSIIASLWNSVFQLLYSFLPEGFFSDVVFQFLCSFSSAFVAVAEAILFLNREAITVGIIPTEHPGRMMPAAPMEDTAEDSPAESVEGTVEGMPTEGSPEEDKKEE